MRRLTGHLAATIDGTYTTLQHKVKQTNKLAIILKKSRDTFTKYITSLVFLTTALNFHDIFANWNKSSISLILCVLENDFTSIAILISTKFGCRWSVSFDGGCGKKEKNWEFHEFHVLVYEFKSALWSEYESDLAEFICFTICKTTASELYLIAPSL